MMCRRFAVHNLTGGVLCVSVMCLFIAPIEFAIASEAMGTNESAVAIQDVSGLRWNSPLVLVECAWLLIVAIGLPIYSCIVSKRFQDKKELRGLNMPRGSIRSILALLVVGSFVNVLVFGAPALGESYESTIAAFGALTGSIIGFYFGNRTAAQTPESKKQP